MGPKRWALDIAGDIIEAWPNVGEEIGRYQLAYIIQQSAEGRGMTVDEG